MRMMWAAAAVLVSGEAAAAPKFVKALTSNDQVGLAVSGKQGSRGVVAMLGMWSDDGALELAGFQERAKGTDPATLRAAEIMTGHAMRSRGLRLTGNLYRAGQREARGWTVSLDARQQQVSDVGAALSGAWRTASDSRLTVGGKLRF